MLCLKGSARFSVKFLEHDIKTSIRGISKN